MRENNDVGSGHNITARFSWRLNRITVSRPPWGPPPGMCWYEIMSFNTVDKIVTKILWSSLLKALLKSTKHV